MDAKRIEQLWKTGSITEEEYNELIEMQKTSEAYYTIREDVDSAMAGVVAADLMKELSEDCSHDPNEEKSNLFIIREIMDKYNMVWKRGFDDEGYVPSADDIERHIKEAAKCVITAIRSGEECPYYFCDSGRMRVEASKAEDDEHWDFEFIFEPITAFSSTVEIKREK